MATKAQLEAEGRSLVKKISDIQNDDALTGAEKSARLDAIQEDFDAHVKHLEASERASEMAAKLDGFGDAKDEKGVSLSEFQVAHPYSPISRKNLAAQLVSSKAYKDIVEKGKHEFDRAVEVKDATEANNLMGELVAGASGPTAIGQNPFGSVGSFAPAILPTWQPGIVEQLFYELTIADLISSIPVSTPNISYMTELAPNMQANEVAEAATYPFSSVSISRVYEQIGKIANAMTLTDEAVADSAQMFNFAQGRLLQSLQRQEEVQFLAGNGYPGVNGLLNRATNFTLSSASSLFGATTATASNVAFPASGTNGAGVQAQTLSSLKYGRVVTGAAGVGAGVAGSYPTAPQIAENLLDAFVDIELQVFKKPNALVMNPRDWQVLRVAKDANGQYYGGDFFGNNYGNSASATKAVWQTPIITTPLMPVGSILVGWFDPSVIQAARREGVRLQMTNANGTDFVDGKVTLRAEERCGLLVYRPAAFQLVQLKVGATGS